EAGRVLRPARASRQRGRGRALRRTQPRRRPGPPDRAPARRSGTVPAPGGVQSAALLGPPGVGAQRRRAVAGLRGTMRDATPIKLLLVESGRAVGGTERVVWELATRLPESRFDLRVWLSDDPGVDELAEALGRSKVAV